MAALKCACPKCRQTLQIAQALPARVKCPRCETVFSLQPAAAPAVAQAVQRPAVAPPPKPAVPAAVPLTPAAAPARTNKALLIGLGAGAAVLLLATLALAVVLVAGGRRASSTTPPPDEDDDLAGFVTTPTKKKASDPRINQAVDRGVSYLKKRLLGPGNLYYFGDSNGPHIGAAALAGLTLLECDVPPADPAVARATEIVRNQRGEVRFTYAIALSVLFLDRLTQSKTYVRDERDEALIRSLGMQLIAAQHAPGGWNYYCQILAPQEETSLARELADGRFRPGGFKVPGQFASSYHDNSIAQFATLALWAARRHGVPVAESLTAEERRYRREQQADGSWTYNERVVTGRDATTCAGLIGLAIGHGVREEAAARDKKSGGGAKGPAAAEVAADPAVARGLLYLSRVIGKPGDLSPQEKARRKEHTRKMDELNRRLLEDRGGNRRQIQQEIRELDTNELATGILFDADAWGDLYLLWSVERVAVIYGLEQKIHGKDWYGWGSEVLLKNQQADGSWQERFPGVPDTCFALLFLKRANVAKDLTDKLRSLGAGLGAGAAPPPATPGRKEE